MAPNTWFFKDFMSRFSSYPRPGLYQGGQDQKTQGSWRFRELHGNRKSRLVKYYSPSSWLDFFEHSKAVEEKTSYSFFGRTGAPAPHSILLGCRLLSCRCCSATWPQKNKKRLPAKSVSCASGGHMFCISICRDLTKTLEDFDATWHLWQYPRHPNTSTSKHFLSRCFRYILGV